MTKEKEIEEMARIIHGTPFSDMHRAVALYNAGYRKKSEAAKEIFEEIDNIIYNLRDSPFYSSSDAVYELTELKKKYTEK